MADATDVTIVNGIPTGPAGTFTVATINKLMALIGEVQASPTANTLLDREKAVKTSVDAVNTTLAALYLLQIGEVQASPTANTLLDRAKAIKTSVDAVNTTLSSGTVTTLGQAPMTASLPVAIASDQTSFPVNPGGGGTSSTDVTRPADVVPYTANDAWTDSTTAPTAGGFTLLNMGRVNGGSGVITDVVITSSGAPATLLQGEIWLFDAAVTAINDNTAFGVTDAEIKTYIGKIPFVMENAGNNSTYHITGLNLAYTCVGGTSLRFVPKVKNGYTPISAEVLTLRAKYIYTS